MFNLQNIYVQSLNNDRRYIDQQIMINIANQLNSICLKQANMGYYSAVVNLRDLFGMITNRPFVEPTDSDLYHLRQLIYATVQQIPSANFSHVDQDGFLGVKLVAQTLDFEHLLVTWQKFK